MAEMSELAGAIEVVISLTTIDARINALHGFPRSLASNEQKIVRFWADIMLARIQNLWPVDTGTSRDRWTYVLSVDPGDNSIIFRNPMYYAAYVFRKGDPLRMPVWEDIVTGSWLLIKAPLLAQLMKQVEANEAALAQSVRQSGPLTGRFAVRRVLDIFARATRERTLGGGLNVG